MLKMFQKRLKIDKILNKKFKSLHFLHEKLQELNISYEKYETILQEHWYLLRIDDINYGCKLLKDNKNRYYLTR